MSEAPVDLTARAEPVVVPDHSVVIRSLSRIGLVVTATAGTLVGLLHLIPPTSAVSPVRRTISEYQLTDLAWVFNLGVIGVALGSAAVFTAAALTRSPRRVALAWGVALGALWVIGMLLIALFTKTDWSVGPSSTGTIHRWASIVAFLSVPVAVPLLVRATGPTTASGRAAALLAALSPLWLLWIVVAMLMGGTGRWWSVVPLGLVERGLAVTEVLSVVFLAVHLLRRQSRSSSRIAASLSRISMTTVASSQRDAVG